MPVVTDDRRGGAAPLAPKRDKKLQITLSEEERALLDKAARAAGFESAASFIRARTLGPVVAGAAGEEKD